MSQAAVMAGKWWAERLDPAHESKREAFSAKIAELVDERLSSGWSHVYLECDYDPLDLLLTAVRETVDPNCRGYLFSADGILPQKHSLAVFPDHLRPKEGYGNRTAEIPIT